MTYQQTLDYLFSSLPMFQRQGKAAYRDNLDNTLALDTYFNHPHKKLKSIHIAGTNGKGSVSHMLASVFQEAGYKTGLYTSPHLKDFRERVRINGEEITENYIVDFVADNKSFFEKLKPSFFEMTVALAFKYFADENVDVAIIEVGMGGRLDSTNIISPELSIITNISKDHTQFLGDTIEKIAIEKAGIVKENIPLVIGQSSEELKPVFIEKAEEKRTEIYFAEDNYHVDYALTTVDEKQNFQVYSGKNIVYPNLKLDLLGIYQKYNLLTTLQSIKLLQEKGFQIKEEHIYNGLENIQINTGLKGRWQIIGHNPRVVCDTAHNEAGIREVVSQIQSTPYKKLHMVIGMVNDKNIDKVLSLLPKNARYYFTKADIPRALEENELMEKASKYKLKGVAISKVADALDLAKEEADKNDFIFVGGSTFVVAEVV
ncbi:MAG: bifunctional folylpolyglutamate synthase/dihydrofolate synthase [Bacteroidetes bacterium]|nr:MAG: bifunctional folylpolyglutamate synthase/dihydrofolate synthase [Bacteroidota bacterium]